MSIHMAGPRLEQRRSAKAAPTIRPRELLWSMIFIDATMAEQALLDPLRGVVWQSPQSGPSSRQDKVP